MSITAHNCCRLLACAVATLASATASAQIAEKLVVQPGAAIESGQSGLEAAWDAGALVPVESLHAPQEGTRYLAIAFRSASGARSRVERYVVEVDGQGPVFEIAGTDAATIWVNASRPLLIDAVDRPAGLAEFTARFGDRELRGSGSTLEVVLDDSSPELILEGRDRIGNVSRRTIGIDRDAPSIRLDCAGACARGAGGLWLAGAEATLRVIAEDGGSGVARTGLSLDGKEVESTLAGLDDGNHSLVASAVDLVGNHNEVVVEVVRDRSGPELSWAIEGQSWQSGDTVWGTLPMRLEVKAEDPAGVAQLSVDGEAGLTPIEGPLTIVENRAPRIVALDELGNRTEIDVPWKADDIKPKIDLVDAEGRSVPAITTLPRGTVLRPVGSDDETGLSKIEIGRGRSFRTAAPEELVLSSELRIELIAHDHAGNDHSKRWRISVGGSE